MVPPLSIEHFVGFGVDMLGGKAMLDGFRVPQQGYR